MLKIAIDAGHGLKTAGKRCMKALDPNETREWVMNSRIAEKLEDLLKDYECEVLRTDDKTGKTDPALSTRCKKANDFKADVFISIHHDAGLNGKKGGGTTVFYYSSKAERKAQAQAFYNSVIAKTKLAGNRSSKVQKKAFAVLKGTDAPAFLIENGFMDSPSDVPIILSDAHADKTAAGLLDFLIDEFKLKKKAAATKPAATKETTAKKETASAAFTPYLAKITASVLNVRAGAGLTYKVNTTVRKNEVYTIVDAKNGWGKLKSGAGWISLNYTKKLRNV